MIRMPSGQPDRSSSPVSSATSAPSRSSPSVSTAGDHADPGQLAIAARTASVTGYPTE